MKNTVYRKKRLFLSESLPEVLEICKQVFGTDDKILLNAYFVPSGIRPIRYYILPKENLGLITLWESKGSDIYPTGPITMLESCYNKKIQPFVFGGSTIFGSGVRDDETIVAYLNRLDGKNTYLNFGIQA